MSVELSIFLAINSYAKCGRNKNIGTINVDATY